MQAVSEKDRVLCKDGRVFHACECNSCVKRGLTCEYRAMRKRGRHGKKSSTPQLPTSSEGPGELRQRMAAVKNEAKHSEPLSLLGYPPFFGPLSSTSGEVEQMISAMTSPPTNGAAAQTQEPEARMHVPHQIRQQSAASIDGSIFSSLGTGIANAFAHTSPVVSPTANQHPGLFAAVAAMQQFSTQTMMANIPAPQEQPARIGSMPPPSLPAANGSSPEAAAKRHESGNWSRDMDDEEQVLGALNTRENDSFGRPVYDPMSYPLPPQAELDEHVNGVFEYFYMGGQTLHEASFRRRLACGSVEPVLVYAMMAVASRYSRRPSLHALKRHGLNHGDLSTNDAGNMLKSRMYLVKAHLDAPFTPSNPMMSFNGSFDRVRGGPLTCACPKTVGELVAQETRRRVWWFLVFVDYFTANVMNVPLEIPPDSYCVRLPCSDEEWMSESLMSIDDMMASEPAPLDSEPVRRCNGLHSCQPPWKFHASAFYLERLMVEVLRPPAAAQQPAPIFIEEDYPYLKRAKQVQSWVERLAKVKAQWSWLHLQLNKWLDSILLRFTEYRHQYYYYLIAAHAAIIMSHGVILQLFTDLSRYIKAAAGSSGAGHSPPIAHGCPMAWDWWARPEFGHFPAGPASSLSPATAAAAMGLLGGNGSDSLAEFGIGALNSVMTPLMNSNSYPSAQSLSGGHGMLDDFIEASSDHLGTHAANAGPSNPQPRNTPNSVLRDLHDMANIAWESCVSTAEQLASVLRGRHPKFVLLGGPASDVMQDLASDANTQTSSPFNAPGSGPGTDNPILACCAKATGASEHPGRAHSTSATPEISPEAEEVLGISPGLSRPTDKIRPLSASVSNSAFMLATAVQLSNAAPPPPTRQGAEKRATIKIRASRLGKAYENLSCMVRVLEGMQQYWHCMDYVTVIQKILKGSEDPFN
ncbi:hypothetical protein DL89DRAFT_289728 [Linderina pennispora]|uniref:Xylanolytic transcriptional activator regulatory domain-containing protein n=1 Tax=Linderina pennispora TaxID=61395 RepID=A0A1Y1WLM0_9FUNG|nr:uncharacterized protein DL89DRAFT_289728 [Linderina pennispora]ORX74086.1 hypothetical protein DL89DRAFT_289728 [Linderina pennispora]